MKKSNVKKVVVGLLSLTMCAGVFASSGMVGYAKGIDSDVVISPMNIAIDNTSNGLSISSAGSAYCEGSTVVNDGYIAEVVVELQQDGTTIKRWTDKGGMTAEIDGSYTVSSGHTYRVKTTHRAYRNGSVADTITKYSSYVYY